jgi:WD40-like Beta Propeller Repeat
LRSQIAAGALGWLAVAVACLGLSAEGAHAAFPGANGRIAFERYDNQANTTISDVRPGVSGSARRLTRIPRRCIRRDPSVYWSDERPRYSPDGNWIAYVHEDDCPGRPAFQRQVRIMRADGTGIRILSRFGDGTRAYDEDGLHPVFTRDGKRLAFIAGDGRAWIISARSGRPIDQVDLPTRLVRPGFDYWTFDLAPSGVAVTTLRPEDEATEVPNPLQGAGLFVGRLGQPFERLTLTPQRRNLGSLDVNADSHPSNRSVIFERQLFCLAGRSPCPVSRADGAGDVYVTGPGRTPRRLTRSGEAWQPAFAPNGRRFVYVGRNGLCVRPMSAQRDQWCGPDGTQPSWQPVTAATR